VYIVLYVLSITFRVTVFLFVPLALAQREQWSERDCDQVSERYILNFYIFKELYLLLDIVRVHF